MPTQRDFCCHLEINGTEVPEFEPRQNTSKSTWYVPSTDDSPFTITLKIPSGFTWGKATCLHCSVYIDGRLVSRFCHLKNHLRSGPQTVVAIDSVPVRVKDLRTKTETWRKATMRFSKVGPHISPQIKETDVNKAPAGDIRVEACPCIHNPIALPGLDEEVDRPVESGRRVFTSINVGKRLTHMVAYEEIKDDECKWPLLARGACQKLLPRPFVTHMKYRSKEALEKLDCKEISCDCRKTTGNVAAEATGTSTGQGERNAGPVPDVQVLETRRDQLRDELKRAKGIELQREIEIFQAEVSKTNKRVEALEMKLAAESSGGMRRVAQVNEKDEDTMVLD